MPIIFIILAIYMIGMVAVGVYGRRYATTFDDSIRAGGRSGILMVAGSAIGAQIGSGFVVGGGENGALMGLGGAWYGIGCGFAYLVGGLILTKYFYRHKYVSLAGFFEDRYGSKNLRIINSGTNFFSAISGMAAQILASKAIFIAFGFDGNIGVIITAIVVLIYVALGGLWSAYVTSAIQTGIIVVGLLFTIIFLFSQGAWGEITAGGLPETAFDMTSIGPEMIAAMTLPLLLSVFVDPATFQRIASAKSQKDAYLGHILCGAVLFVFAFFPVIIGMYGRVLFPEAEASAVFMQVLITKLSPVIAGLMIAAILAAIMSSCDGSLVVCSTMVVNDLYKELINPKASDKLLKGISYVIYVVVTIASILIALAFNNIISLLSMTYTILQSGCLIPFVGGLVWKRATAQGAALSSILGISTSLLIMAGLIAPPYSSVFPLLPALIGFIVGSLFSKPKAAGAE